MDELTIVLICERVLESSFSDYIYAWSQLGKKGLHKNLQGFFGRTLQQLIDNDILDNNYEVNETVFLDLTDEFYEPSYR